MAAPLIAAAILGGLQVVKGIEDARIMRENANIQRRIDEANARYAEVDAFEAMAQGFGQAARYQGKVIDILSAQKTAFAARGVDSTYGTAAAIQEDTRRTGFLNVLDIQTQAQGVARGYQKKIDTARLNAELRFQSGIASADSTQTASYLNAGSTLLSGYSREMS